MDSRGTPTRSVGRVGSKDELLLPKFDYYIDESDPDIVILRRQEGSLNHQQENKN